MNVLTNVFLKLSQDFCTMSTIEEEWDEMTQV